MDCQQHGAGGVVVQNNRGVKGCQAASGAQVELQGDKIIDCSAYGTDCSPP